MYFVCPRYVFACMNKMSAHENLQLPVCGVWCFVYSWSTCLSCWGDRCQWSTSLCVFRNAGIRVFCYWGVKFSRNYSLADWGTSTWAVSPLRGLCLWLYSFSPGSIFIAFQHFWKSLIIFFFFFSIWAILLKS